MNLAHWLQRAAQAKPDKPALFRGKTETDDYASFHAKVASLSNWLGQQGVGVGDRVAIFMKNQPEYLIAFWAVWYAGAVVVPINAKLHWREASWIVDNAGARICFSIGAEAEVLKDKLPKTKVVEVAGDEWTAALGVTQKTSPERKRDDDLAWLFYTSGTTGQPKGVMITHGMLRSMALCYFADVDTVTERDSALYAAPLSHGAGIYNLMHVLKGARHVFPISGSFEPVEIFDLASTFGNVHMFAAPTMVVRMTRAAIDCKAKINGFRTVVYAGGPMYVPDLLEAHEIFGDIFVQIYGQGECPMGITALPRSDVSERSKAGWQERLGSVGRAQSAVEVRVGDGAGKPKGFGDIGEVMVRGATVMPGYWRNPEATSKTLIDGWLMTGDIGTLDADGYLTLIDRSKDVIISGGSNVYPREVEEILIKHPEVAEASVIGQPDPDWGEQVVAFYVGEADASELDQLCLDNIARFKRPQVYHRVEELPKNSYGKVLKTKLRDRLRGVFEEGRKNGSLPRQG